MPSTSPSARPRDQSLDHRPDGHAGDLHGGPGHLDRQRRAAAHGRQPVGLRPREHLGVDQLPGRQRGHPAAVGLAVVDPRPEAVLHLLRRAVHGQLGALRHGHEHRATGPVPGAPGPGRRRLAAVRAGHPHGHLPARQARHGHGRVHAGDPRRARAGADPRRLHHRELQLAMDLLHQPPRRRDLGHAEQPAAPGPALSEGAEGRAEGAAVPHGLHRARPALDRPGLAGADARQGAGARLVRLALHRLAVRDRRSPP